MKQRADHLSIAANRLHEALRGTRGRPTIQSIRTILEVAWLASMKTEEGQSTVCTLSYVNPENPDPDPPWRIRLQRQKFYELKPSIPLTVRSLAKLAPALGPHAANIAVYPDNNGQIFIVGMTDQQVGFRRALEHEGDGFWDPPGLFQIDVLGIGSININMGDAQVAAIRQDSITFDQPDVFTAGPISKQILKFAAASRKLNTEERERAGLMASTCLSRVLVRMQRYRHGGALLLDRSPPKRLLTIKYPIKYERLAEVSRAYIAAESAVALCHDEWSIARYNDEPDEQIVKRLLSDKVDLDDATEAMAGAIPLVASLSRVDGLVLLAPELVVRGFGCEIRADEDPPRVYLVSQAKGMRQNRRPISQSAYGTRHRSMLRYCWKRPDSVGIVVSQDGDVRAIKRVGQSVIMWDNIKIHRVSTASRHRPAK